MALPKQIKKCKSCKKIYVQDDIYKGTCPSCGAKN